VHAGRQPLEAPPGAQDGPGARLAPGQCPQQGQGLAVDGLGLTLGRARGAFPPGLVREQLQQHSRRPDARRVVGRRLAGSAHHDAVQQAQRRMAVCTHQAAAVVARLGRQQAAEGRRGPGRPQQQLPHQPLAGGGRGQHLLQECRPSGGRLPPPLPTAAVPAALQKRHPCLNQRIAGRRARGLLAPVPFSLEGRQLREQPCAAPRRGLVVGG
jgi:hypothetical protein